VTTAATFLRRIVTLLDAANVPYMLTGSFASTFHGTPRATQDIDLVVAPASGGLKSFAVSCREEGFYLDDIRVRDAEARRGQFNVIDSATGWKADLIVQKARPFSVMEFSRRQSAQLLGIDVLVASPEDVVLSKLEWALRGGSERQLQDAAAVLAVQGDRFDVEYVERWAAQLGVGELWRRISGR
jgi:hypothetical protein